MFFLTYILQYIFSLSKTRTHVPFLFLFVVSLGSRLAAVEQDVEILKKNHVLLVVINVGKSRSDSLVEV